MSAVFEYQTVRVAAVNWRLSNPVCETSFFDHLKRLVVGAADKQARLVVLPELFIVELVGLLSDYNESRIPEMLHQYFEPTVEVLTDLAVRYQMTIIAGSLFRRVGEQIFNTCPVIHPDGQIELRDKQYLINYESEVWNLAQGKSQKPFLNPELGVCICFDSEFPTLSSELSSYGMTLLCVPSHCATQAAVSRVRYSCLARAVENQIYVVKSCLVGQLPDHEVYGKGPSAIMAPPCVELSESGILSQAIDPDEEEIVLADLNFEDLWRIRNSGAVCNWRIQFGDMNAK